MKQHAIYLIIFLFQFLLSPAQKHQLKVEVGKPMPDIKLRNIEYFQPKNATVHSFKGKWLVLDFWHKTCTGCIASMPKTNADQKQFQGQVQFILVGRQDKENKIRTVYEKYREKYDLELPIVYDSALHNLLGVTACPHIFVIDPAGIVRANTYYLDSNDIREFLKGNSPVIQNFDSEIAYNEKQPLLIDGNGGMDSSFLFRSLLTRYIPGTRYFPPPSITHAIKYYSKFEVLCANLAELYCYAYLDIYRLTPSDSMNGKVFLQPVFETTDTADFIHDFGNGRNIYNYSLICPKSKTNTGEMQQIMQRDLMNYFGYQVFVENRLMPYWKLTASEDARQRLKTKGGPTSFTTKESESVDFTVVNYNKLAIVSHIWLFHQFDIPFVDETGIDGKIDFSMEAIFTDLESVRTALQKQGLDLVKDKKMMKVLVIRSAKQHE